MPWRTPPHIETAPAECGARLTHSGFSYCRRCLYEPIAQTADGSPRMARRMARSARCLRCGPSATDRPKRSPNSRTPPEGGVRRSGAMRRPRARRTSGHQAAASFNFLSGRTLTLTLAGLAANHCSSLVNGLMPLRFGLAGTLTTVIFSRPGRVNAPAPFLLTEPCTAPSSADITARTSRGATPEVSEMCATRPDLPNASLIGFGAADLAADFGAAFFDAAFFFAIYVLWITRCELMECLVVPLGRRNVGHATVAAKPRMPLFSGFSAGRGQTARRPGAETTLQSSSTRGLKASTSRACTCGGTGS